MRQSGLDDREVAYLHGIRGVHTAAVGELVGTGAQHVVRAYAPEEGNVIPRVIKYPRAKALRDVFSACVSPSITPTVAQMERDVRLCKAYLSPFTVTPDVHTDAESQRYALLQPRLKISDLTPGDVHRDGELRRELLEIIDGNRRLLAAEKLWFDFMGWNMGNILRGHAYLDNVCKRAEPSAVRLAIVDCTLFPAPNRSLRGIHAWFLQQVQRLNLRRYGVAM